MATVVHAANAHTTISGGWTNPSNAFATTTDGVFATISSVKNTTQNGDFGFANFTTAEIPDGSTINSVTVTVNWGMTASVTGGVLGTQLRNGSTSLGTETTQTSITQQNATQVVTSGVSLSDLRSASTLLKARTRCTKGNTSTAMTGNLDFLSLTVDFTPPPPGDRLVDVTGKAKATAQRRARHAGGITLLAAVAVAPNNIAVNRAIPLGITARMTSGVGQTVRLAPITQVRKRIDPQHKGGSFAGGLVPAFALNARVNQPIPLTITARVTSGSQAPLVPPYRLQVHRNRPKPHPGGVTSLGLLLPASDLGIRVNKPIPLTISAIMTGATIAPAAGVLSIERADPKPRRGRVILVKANPTITRVLSVNKPIPLSITAAMTSSHALTVNQPIPLTVLARLSANVDLSVNQAIPITISSHVSVDSLLAVDRAIPLSIAAAITSVSGRSLTVSRAIPLGISSTLSANVDLTVNRPLPIGIVSTMSGAILLNVNQAIPLQIQARLITVVVSAGTPGPTAVDVLTYQPSTVDLVNAASSVDLVNFLGSSLDILNQRSSLTILSSESPDMPNLVQPMKQGDTSPSLVATLGTLQDDGTIAPDDLTGCAVVVNIKLGSKLIVTDGACTVVDAVNGKAQYDWGANDTAKSGDAQAEFKSTTLAGKVKRYPDSGNFIVKITPQVGP